MSGPIDRFWLERHAQDAVEVDDREVDLESLPHCPNCNYIVYKSTSLRCPECGTRYSREDLKFHTTREMLARRARRDRVLAWIGSTAYVAGAAMVVLALARGRPVASCIVIPLLVLTGWTIGQRLILGDPPAGLVWTLGFLWLVVGVGLHLL